VRLQAFLLLCRSNKGLSILKKSALGFTLFNATALLFALTKVHAQPADPATTSAASAQPISITRAADISIETFFRPAAFGAMRLSPSGKKVAVIVPVNGRSNLRVIDLETRTATAITGLSDYDVYTFSWIDETRLYFSTANLGDASGEIYLRGRYAVDVDGKNIRNLLAPTSRTQYQVGTATYFEILSRTYDGTGEVIAEMNERSKEYPDVYRFDTRTGRYKLLTHDNPGNIVRWVVDQNLIPRIAVRSEPREAPNKPRQQTIWHRANENSAWEKIWTNNESAKVGSLSPIAFDFDNTTLYVSSNQGRDKRAIYKFDIANKKLGELVVEHPLIDLYGGLIFSRDKKKLIGIYYSADMPNAAWFDDDFARLQQRIDKTFPGMVNDFASSLDSDTFLLIRSHSDRDSGAFFLYNIAKNTMERVGQSRPWLPPKMMGERRFVRYKARDGLEIPAWLTLPADSAGKGLPLIVHIHGGPWVRGFHGTSWGGQPIAQFFASRGYAVLEPEPRGSTGYGRKHYNLSMKQWGLTMQDDITDGAMHLVKEGIVDQSRMCLFGASYGGYATLQGLVKDPELWRCGSAYVAVTDLELMQTVQYSDTARLTDFYETDFKRRVGDKDADKDQFQRTSPAKNADKIRAPIMLTMGSDDQRVPLIHGTTMRDALQRAGKSLEYVVYPGEAHGFNKQENVIDFFKRNEKFFAEHLKAVNKSPSAPAAPAASAAPATPITSTKP
jgi:dipeptidyl aminopeptidase/acylaminoacyl peptidase